MDGKSTSECEDLRECLRITRRDAGILERKLTLAKADRDTLRAQLEAVEKGLADCKESLLLAREWSARMTAKRDALGEALDKTAKERDELRAKVEAVRAYDKRLSFVGRMVREPIYGVRAALNEALNTATLPKDKP